MSIIENSSTIAKNRMSKHVRSSLLSSNNAARRIHPTNSSQEVDVELVVYMPMLDRNRCLHILYNENCVLNLLLCDQSERDAVIGVLDEMKSALRAPEDTVATKILRRIWLEIKKVRCSRYHFITI